MKIKVAKESGLCFGVKKALDTIESIEDKKSICVLGKLIHNPQIIEKLRMQGVRFTEDINKVDCTLVISAHGVSDHVLQEARKKHLKIIDTTCPLVKNVHNITLRLEAQGYRIIIFGDKNHTEVMGIKGNLHDPIIIGKIEDLGDIIPGRYALVSQTTQDVDKFNEISGRLREKVPGLLVSDTICSATKSRQRNAKELAAEVDLMIVIGGYASANTMRLKEICETIVETKHIESYHNLRKEWFEDKEIIGLTAGASTPGGVIKSVIQEISRLCLERS